VILLDTNVISAFMKPEPDAAVASWLNTQRRESLWMTAITVFEIRTGLEILALSRRRQALEDAFTRALEQPFVDVLFRLTNQPRKPRGESRLQDARLAGRLRFATYRLPASLSRATQLSPRATSGTSKISGST
jgi:hypothetical protein